MSVNNTTGGRSVRNQAKAARLLHLPATSGRSTRINDNQFRVAAQAIVQGMQDINVMAATPSAGPGHGQIAVRVGRLLVYVNDREAMESFVDAWLRAEALADQVFGPLDPPESRRRSVIREGGGSAIAGERSSF